MNALRLAVAQSVGLRRHRFTPAVVPTGAPPDLVTDPVIGAGQPQVGIAHDYTPGTWSGAASVTANWMLDDVVAQDAISGPTYTPVTGDIDKHLLVVETATSPTGVQSTASTQAKTVLPA